LADETSFGLKGFLKKFKMPVHVVAAEGMTISPGYYMVTTGKRSNKNGERNFSFLSPLNQ
jgi:hypothetical protein